MGGIFSKRKDMTAMGVAKVRLTEDLREEESRLFSDSFARFHVPGYTVMRLMGSRKLEGMYESRAPGLYALLATRTRWLDDAVVKAVEEHGIRQILILGAGYDMRGFRLPLPDDVRVFEVDQPDVQVLKRSNISRIRGLRNKPPVTFVPVDFNQQSLAEELRKSPFDPSIPTLVTMEGITQYISKDSTAAAIGTLKELCAPGSRLAISYIDQRFYDAPIEILGAGWGPNHSVKVEDFLRSVTSVGEPWIAGWRSDEFATFLKSVGGFEVLSDVTLVDLNERYMKPLGRSVPADSMFPVEHNVEAVLSAD